jgi:hypothetical protein
MTGGTYGVFLSVGDRLGKPIVALPLENDDDTRRYRVGTCAVQGDYTVELVDARLKGTELQTKLRWQPHHELPATATPFLHLDQSGKIAVAQGVPDSVDVSDLRAGKEQTIAHTMTVPEGAKSPLRLCVGLWCPDRMGKGNERLRPDQGMGDRRVVIGTLERVNGTWMFQSGEKPH